MKEVGRFLSREGLPVACSTLSCWHAAPVLRRLLWRNATESSGMMLCFK